MARSHLLFGFAVATALTADTALAEQPVQSLPKKAVAVWGTTALRLLRAELWWQQPLRH